MRVGACLVGLMLSMPAQAQEAARYLTAQVTCPKRTCAMAEAIPAAVFSRTITACFATCLSETYGRVNCACGRHGGCLARVTVASDGSVQSRCGTLP